MRFLALASLATLASVPAFAQDAPEALDLVATVVAGVRAESSVRLGPVDNGYVTRRAAGVFDVSAEGGPVAHMTITENSPCVFDATFAVGDAPPVGTVRFDFNRVTAVTLEPRESRDAMNVIHLTLDGPDDVVQSVYPDGRIESASNNNTMYTMLTLADIQAAADQLREACPAS